ncbi:hypothetical protein [Microvirga alba]|uniref:Alpha/beta hydrolase n=1 Tax=Microvirga alba TaxID=2791025 RepID=A0A931BSK4_9HYPH|nr:hypothetical protein [Microvirga alba]MBF9234014.1 hypothetical protein [Microvirga alba]
MHGLKSWAVSTTEIDRMAQIRPVVTRVVKFDCGHTIHDEATTEFADEVASFLSQFR